MSEQIDWSKAQEGATHANGAGVFLRENKSGSVSNFDNGKWIMTSSTIADFNHGYIFERPTTPSWSGEGLPPVGAVCEYNPMPVGKPKKWHKVEVVYASEWVIVMRCIEAPSGHEGGNGVEIAMAVDSCSLEDIRHIRTPEQIEADQREAQIVAIHDAIVTSVNVTLGQCDSWRKVAEMVYDAGFKRPE